MADEILDAITKAAQSPEEAETDAGRVKMPNLKDMVAADKYVRALGASAAMSGRSPWAGLRGGRVVPPGSV